MARVEDWRRGLNLLAAPEILRISPEPLLRTKASAIALGTRGSGSCIGVGGWEAGGLRPRGPSGDDWSDVYAGVDALEGPEGLRTDLGVIVRVGNPTACVSGDSGEQQVRGCESWVISRLGRADGHAREGAMGETLCIP